VKNIIKNIWTVLIEKERKRFVWLVILDLVISLLDIFSLFLLLWIVQFYIQPGANNHLSFLPSWLIDRNSVVFIALFFVLFSLKNLAAFAIGKAHHRFSSDVAIRISENNLIKYQQGNFNEFIHVDSSEHIRKIAFQPFEFCQHILSGIQQIITQGCLILITVIAIVLFNAKLFILLMCILLPPVFIVFYLMKKRLAAARSQIRTNNEASYRYLFDALKGYVEGNIFNRNDFFLKRFIQARQKFSKHLFDTLSLQNMPSRIIEIFAVMGLFILIAIAKWTGNNDNATLLTIGAFMAAAYKIIPGIVKVMNTLGQIKAYEFSLTDFEQKQEMNIATAIAPKKLESIQLKGISFHHAEMSILKDFTLCMKKGDFIGIEGRSGRGKTTLFNILLGFLPQKNGELFFNEESINYEEIKSYWPSIAYVRQQNFLIHDTILRNITLEEEAYDEKQLTTALKVSGLQDFIQQLPEGIDKVVTENGKNISGGQQQRIAIARTLYKNADLVLLDEPFSELDEASEVSLLKHFRNVAEAGKIVVMITHNKKALSYCTKTVCLDEN
jgi:ABC-type multidrug transport system fused ATPase/permease subunit